MNTQISVILGARDNNLGMQLSAYHTLLALNTETMCHAHCACNSNIKLFNTIFKQHIELTTFCFGIRLAGYNMHITSKFPTDRSITAQVIEVNVFHTFEQRCRRQLNLLLFSLSFSSLTFLYRFQQPQRTIRRG